jgi:hypothetical protein
LLELVLRAFQDGATPEAIVQRYPTLGLVDVVLFQRKWHNTGPRLSNNLLTS